MPLRAAEPLFLDALRHDGDADADGGAAKVDHHTVLRLLLPDLRANVLVLLLPPRVCGFEELVAT